MGGGRAEERYKKLGLRESIGRIYQYALACKELSLILSLSFSKLPKNLQFLIFDDTLTAFRTLPEMQTKSAIEAANLLLQASEAALPMQKRALAAKEFKHAMVAHKRRWKVRQEGEGISQLPQDVLVHIFSFLDLRSFVSAALVCRSWNGATGDNNLWQLQYFIFFADSSNHSEVKILQSGQVEKKCTHLQDDVVTRVGIDWREAFKRAYEGIFSKKFITSSRGYCRHCNAIVWLNDMKFNNEHCRPSCKNHLIKPVSTQKIVEFVMEGYLLWISSSDSDSDSEETSNSRLWAYPRLELAK